jgi:hypothetical protein
VEKVGLQETPKPSEDLIHDKLFREILPKTYSDSVIIKNWMGWSHRGPENKREQMKFWREFDIAIFQRETVASAHNLVLTGFEIKGFAQKPTRFPAFAEGLDQAIVLLAQGADFAYLVHPEPEKEGDKYALRDMCQRFAPMIGLIFVPHDLSKLSYLRKYREAVRNFSTTQDTKRTMLASLLAGGLRDEISELPSWCKQVQY